jgi:hypothetical protein
LQAFAALYQAKSFGIIYREGIDYWQRGWRNQ